jgi:hypothetical protein
VQSLAGLLLDLDAGHWLRGAAQVAGQGDLGDAVAGRDFGFSDVI